MIIYSNKTLVIPVGISPNYSNTGVEFKTQEKSRTYTTNGSYTVSPDSGYNGLSKVSVTVAVPEKTFATQEKMVSSNGVVTPDEGFDGLSKVTVDVPASTFKVQEKTVSPAITKQEVTASTGYDGLSKVTVNPVTYSIDSNILPSNIKEGVTILGVEGTFEGGKPTESKTVDPSTNVITVTPSENYTLDQVTVNPVTRNIDSNIISSNIKSGVSILGVEGTVEEVKPEQSKSVDPSTNSVDVTPDDGYALNKVTVEAVTSSIDSNITAGNIKKGTSILGVTGTLENTSLPSLTITWHCVTTGTYKSSGNTQYLTKIVVDGVDCTPDASINGVAGTDYTVEYYVDYDAYNIAHSYPSDYKCVPSGFLGFYDNFSKTIQPKTIVLGDVNVIDQYAFYNSYETTLTISNNLKLVRRGGVTCDYVNVNADIDVIEQYGFEFYGKNVVYIRGNIGQFGSETPVSRWYTNFMSYASSGMLGTFRILAPIKNAPAAFPYSADDSSSNVVDVIEGNETLGYFTYTEDDDDIRNNWIEDITTVIIPSTNTQWSGVHFDSQICRPTSIVSFASTAPSSTSIEKDSGTSAVNGTLFVPSGATGYDSWLTALNKIGTWTMVEFTPITNMSSISESSSGYFGYTDQVTGRHLLFNLNASLSTINEKLSEV